MGVVKIIFCYGFFVKESLHRNEINMDSLKENVGNVAEIRRGYAKAQDLLRQTCYGA
jgi:hypothetical protein